MIVHDISHNISTDISYCIGCPVDPEPPEPSFDPSKLEYQALWIANGKTNNDTDKNVPNLVDASNPLVTNNFLWDETSGYMADGLQFDGVDDHFKSNTMPISRNYTIVTDILNHKLGKRGITKTANWYFYGNALYINGTSVSSIITDVSSFNSDGLVVKKDKTTTTIPVGSDFSNNVVQSIGATEFIFKSLAIIPQVLDEKQILSVYEYLKTLKANNLG